MGSVVTFKLLSVSPTDLNYEQQTKLKFLQTITPQSKDLAHLTETFYRKPDPLLRSHVLRQFRGLAYTLSIPSTKVGSSQHTSREGSQPLQATGFALNPVLDRQPFLFLLFEVEEKELLNIVDQTSWARCAMNKSNFHGNHSVESQTSGRMLIQHAFRLYLPFTSRALTSKQTNTHTVFSLIENYRVKVFPCPQHYFKYACHLSQGSTFSFQLFVTTSQTRNVHLRG